MENKRISQILRLLSQLMELHDENPFKVKSIANAAFKINKLPFPIAAKTPAEIEKIEGLGKSTASKITELLQTGTLQDLDQLTAQTPEGVVEMLNIKGIGAKKVAIIWHELKIENVGELYYACNENRLIEAKGFGLKTQEEIRKAIEFKMSSHGSFLYVQAEPEAEELLQKLKKLLPDALIEVGGQYRRRLEIINELLIVIGAANPDKAITVIEKAKLFNDINFDDQVINAETENGLKIVVICVSKPEFYIELFIQTGDDDHTEEVLARADKQAEPGKLIDNEKVIYQNAGLSWIPPELREGKTYIDNNIVPALIKLDDLKGTLHNHSTWSDGMHTLEEMALYCRDELKLEYLGISDHSKSAFYAKGLSIERVIEQHEEINQLNKKLDNFHIFKGIESDILNDGSLDYPEEILKMFDFIVASVHANLKMDEPKATARLIKAIENPYTTILGHPTGRLLLTRKGYDIDYKKVIDACAANNVVIEVNSNPFRLDLDWRWHAYALQKGVKLSINPDAHRNQGFLDMKYGVLVARKGGLTKEMCLNALRLSQIAEVFSARQSKIA